MLFTGPDLAWEFFLLYWRGILDVTICQKLWRFNCRHIHTLAANTKVNTLLSQIHARHVIISYQNVMVSSYSDLRKVNKCTHTHISPIWTMFVASDSTIIIIKSGWKLSNLLKWKIDQYAFERLENGMVVKWLRWFALLCRLRRL